MTRQEFIEKYEAYQEYCRQLTKELGLFRDLLITQIGKFNRGDCQLRILASVPAHVLISLRDETVRLAKGESDDNSFS